MFGVTPSTLARQRVLAQMLGMQQGLQPQAPNRFAPPAFQAPPAQPGMLQRTAAPGLPAVSPPPPQPQPPAPAQDDFAVTVPAPRLVPDDSPLAMDKSAQAFAPKKPTFLNQLGFLAQAFDEGPRGYTEGRQAWESGQRTRFQETQVADGRKTAIDAVRMILARDTDPLVRQVAQVAGTPEAFMQWYTQHKDKADEFQRTDRQLDQGDRGLDQNDKRIGLSEKELTANTDAQRGQLGLGWFDAKTRRMATEDALGSKDPVEKGLISNDVDQIQKMTESADSLGSMIPDLRTFLELNGQESTGPVNPSNWSPLPNDATQQMRQITTRLAPKLKTDLPGAMSDGDRQFLIDMVPNTGRSRLANAEIIGRYVTAAGRAQERAYYAREYMRRDRSLGTFNRLWSAYINAASIAQGDKRSFAQWLSETKQAADAAPGPGARSEQRVRPGNTIR